MKRQIIFITAILIYSGTLVAQDKTRLNSINVYYGIGHLKIQDFIFSPMIHQDWSPLNAILSYGHSGKLEHQLYVKFGQYQSSLVDPYSFYWDVPEESLSTGPHTYTRIDLNYSLGNSLINRGDFTLVLGVRSRNRFQPSSNYMGAFESFGYYFSIGLDAWTRLDYTFHKMHHFTVNLALPFFSYNVRSPYMSADDWFFEDTYSHKDFNTFFAFLADGGLQSWGKSQSLDFDLSYYYDLTGKWGIGAVYWFSINKNQTPRKLTSVENILSLSVKYIF